MGKKGEWEGVLKPKGTAILDLGDCFCYIQGASIFAVTAEKRKLKHGKNSLSGDGEYHDYGQAEGTGVLSPQR